MILRLGLAMCFLWALSQLALGVAGGIDEGNSSITAVPCESCPVIDGILSPGEWEGAAVASDFTQIEPDYGQLTQHATIAYVLYNNEFLFVAAVCRDSVGAKPRIADIGRDFEFAESDGFGFVLDLLHDRRNAVGFFTNPSGAQLDVQSFDERLIDSDWNTVWRVQTEVTDSGWTCEFAVPWKSLRYARDAETVGINFQRLHRRHNEWSVWSPHSRGYSVFRVDEAGTLTGLHLPETSSNLTIVPYSLSKTDGHASNYEAGGDSRWAPDPWTTLEFTANTDFAQADVDRAVINLNRFSVLFPERRQFFLENSGTFQVGGGSLLLQPFFSRRIGLDVSGRPEYLDAGLRFLRRGTETNAGLLAVRTRSRDSSLTSYHVVGRASHNFGEQNRIGGLLTFRHDAAETQRRQNIVGAIDGFVRSGHHLAIEYMVTGSIDDNQENGKVQSGVASLLNGVYRTDNFNIYAGETVIMDEYRAETGFVAWPDIAATELGIDYFWRPRWKPDWMLEMAPAFYVNTYHRASDRQLLEARLTVWPVYVSFKSGAVFYILWNPTWEHLESGFEPVDGVTIDADDYSYHRILAKAATDHSARMGARVYLETGSFYDGFLTSLRPRLYFRPSAHLSLATASEWNRFQSVGSSSKNAGASLYSLEAEIAPSPRLQFSSYYEYGSEHDSETLQLRFNWEFRPLSHVFVVYTAMEGEAGHSVRTTETSAIFKIVYQYQL